MLYTGAMTTFNVQEREVKILMESHPPHFRGSLVFKISLDGFTVYVLFLKVRKK